MNIVPVIEGDRWEPPTLKSVEQMEDNPLVVCACGRTVSADMMRVVADGYACDACLETLFREKTLTREEFALSHNAPDSVIAKAREVDAVVSQIAEAATLSQ